MTGYGRNVVSFKTTNITVEMRSVNHRYLDISIKTPPSLLFFEDKIKKLIQKNFKRGRIEIYINIEGEQFINKTLKTDWKLLDQFMDTIKNIKEKYQLSGDIPMTLIPTIPDIITVQESEDEPDELIELLIMSIQRVCEQVLETRKKEADYIIKDMKQRMLSIEKAVSFINDLKHDVANDYHKRIIARIDEFVSGEVIDEHRLHQEIAFLIERGDITEEVVRLLSHIEHFNKVLNKDGAIGRTLDFIVQEMHREINTIGSKTIDPKTSKKVVFIKGEIEKIREQIQNIE